MHSNALAPLLGAAAASLRQLQLTVAQPPNASLAAALRAATGLTSLSLRFTSKKPGRQAEWEPEDGTRLDCGLLRGMAQLRELRVDEGERLAAPAALAALPLADLALGGPGGLAALAPHAAGLTRLELSGCSAADLRRAEPPAAPVLGRLMSLLSVVLGGHDSLRHRNNAEGAAKAKQVSGDHEAAVAALQALLPAGCRVQAEPPAVHLW